MKGRERKALDMSNWIKDAIEKSNIQQIKKILYSTDNNKESVIIINCVNKANLRHSEMCQCNLQNISKNLYIWINKIYIFTERSQSDCSIVQMCNMNSDLSEWIFQQMNEDCKLEKASVYHHWSIRVCLPRALSISHVSLCFINRWHFTFIINLIICHSNETLPDTLRY